MKEVTGDFWDHLNRNDYDAIVCTTNKVVKNDGRLVMGGGIARDFRERYLDLDFDWGQRLLKRPKQNIMISPGPANLWLVAFPTKDHFKDDSILSLIVDSAKELKTITDTLDWDNVLSTRFGCGLGNLNWDEVKSAVSPYLDDRFTIINHA